MRTLKVKITCIKTDHTGQEDIKEHFANVKAGEKLNIDYEKLAGYKVVTLEAVEEKYEVYVYTFQKKNHFIKFDRFEDLPELLKDIPQKEIQIIETKINEVSISSINKDKFLLAVNLFLGRVQV